MKREKPPKTPKRPPAPAFDLTDRGNAERLSYYFGDRIKYVKKWRMFIVWNNHCWERDADGTEILALAMRAIDRIQGEIAVAGNKKKAQRLFAWKKQSGGASRLEAMLRLVRALPKMTIQHEQLDQHPYLLNCKNGTVDLVTGKIKRHDPDDLMTKMIDIDFDPKATAPKFVKFLSQVVPDKNVFNFLQRFAGYCATGDVEERMFVVLHGGGRNGKSVFLRCLQKALGPYATSAAPGLLMAKQQDAHPAEVADLYGARLAVASEVRKGRVFDEEAVKRLTGNDRLKARFMRENFWEYDPSFKLLIAANHKPRVRDASDSFWDRIALVSFDVRIAENKLDRKLPTKLNGELQGILAWIVEGCLKWQKTGLQPPEVVKAATKEYRETEDVIGMFLNERCDLRPAEAKLASTPITPTADLMKAVRGWCEANNFYVFSEKDLAERLDDAGCELTRTKAFRGWKGVTLIPRSARPKGNVMQLTGPLGASGSPSRSKPN